MLTGRNSGSVLVMNSDPGYAFRTCVRPSVFTIFDAADEPADRIREQEIAVHIRGVPVSAHDLGPGRRREVAQVVGRHPDAREAALHVADPGAGHGIS